MQLAVAALCKELNNIAEAVAYPGILFGERGGQQIQLRTEDIEKGDLGAVAP